MADVPVFREEDRDNLEFVRQIILTRLKQDAGWNQFERNWPDRRDHVQLEGPQPELGSRFTVLADEVMWQLIIEGVIAPGYSNPYQSHNPALPWFHITDYGRKVLSAGRSIPHDPTGYLDALKVAATTTVGEVTIAYVEEALRCFNRGCHVAAVLLLGVAAESVFLQLCTVVRAALKRTADQKAFDELPDQVKHKHRWIVAKYRALPGSVRRSALPESLDVNLTVLYDLIRRQRNDLGHPQEHPPEVNREQAFVFFQLFPTYVTDIEAFAAYCQASGL
jgi:hypothetical protein